MGFAETFFEQVGEARRPTMAFAQTLDFPRLAAGWLLMQYQTIRATTPVLERATNASDRAMREFYEIKLREERGHDLMWFGDLRHAGLSAPEVLGAPPNPFVAEMVGRQYYLIDFVHPSAYLGFIGLLEGFQPTVEQVDELARISGLPSAAFRTARMHAVVDIEHRKELAEMLDAVPRPQQFAILDNGIRCTELQRAALMFLSKEKPHGNERPSTRSTASTPPGINEPRQHGGDGARGGHL